MEKIFVYNLPRLTLIDLMKENGFTQKSNKQTIFSRNHKRRRYADDLALLANTPAQAESLLHIPKQTAGGIGLHMNTNKTEFICFKQEGAISPLSCWPLKLVDNFSYPHSNISSTESNVNIRQAKALAVINRLSIMWKSNLSDEIKRGF